MTYPYSKDIPEISLSSVDKTHAYIVCVLSVVKSGCKLRLKFFRGSRV